MSAGTTGTTGTGPDGVTTNCALFPVCIAKTQYSFSDNPLKINAAEDHELHVSEVSLKAGAEFIVVQCGSIMTMPGLPKVPAAENIGVREGRICGLF